MKKTNKKHTVSISDVTELSIDYLVKLGFRTEEAVLMTENFIEGELTGKKSHGLVRIFWIKEMIESESISLISDEEIEVVKETPVSLLVDGKNKTGFYVVNKALELGINKVRKSGMVALGVTNTAPASGLVGLYARKAAEEDLIFIGFNNSSGGLVPYGSTQEMWGTNPLTVGIPSKDTPVILDMASSQITWGHLLIAKAQGKEIPEGVAIDSSGNITTSPGEAMKGGLLPISGHKGSGLAFIVELLGGALTSSRVGNSLKGGWGSFMILIDPNILRDLKDFKKDVSTAIKELKNSNKMPGFKEIYYPGERSQISRDMHIKRGSIELSDELYRSLNGLAHQL